MLLHASASAPPNHTTSPIVLQFSSPPRTHHETLHEHPPSSGRARRHHRSLSDDNDASASLTRKRLDTSDNGTSPKHTTPKQRQRINHHHRSRALERHIPAKQRYMYGNFPAFSIVQIRTAIPTDHRADIMPSNWYNNKACLDIGCGVGQLTMAIGL